MSEIDGGFCPKLDPYTIVYHNKENLEKKNGRGDRAALT